MNNSELVKFFVYKYCFGSTQKKAMLLSRLWIRLQTRGYWHTTLLNLWVDWHISRYLVPRDLKTPVNSTYNQQIAQFTPSSQKKKSLKIQNSNARKREIDNQRQHVPDLCLARAPFHKTNCKKHPLQINDKLWPCGVQGDF